MARLRIEKIAEIFLNCVFGDISQPTELYRCLMWEVKTSGPRMGYYFMNFCGSPVHQISIYTVLALSYTAVIRKKAFFSERD